MNQNKKTKSVWLAAISLGGVGAIVLSLLILIPFADQKNFLDSIAADGNVESFTIGVYSRIKIFSIPLAIIFYCLLIYLLAFKKRSLNRIDTLIDRSMAFIFSRQQEFKELIKAAIPTRDEFIPLLILLGITLIGIFFRYAYLWRPMGHDETYTFMAFASRGLRVTITDYHLPNNHVFHTILVSLITRLFGDSPAIIRMPTFVAGVLIIPATYLLGKIFYGSNIGLVGASIVASLPVMIDYSTTARGYTIITLFALLIVALAAYLKDHRNLVAWGIMVVFASLGLYTNPTMIYPIGMVFTWLLLSKFIGDVNPIYGNKYYYFLLGSSTGIILITVVLYAPIIYYSGLQSIIGNDVIEALSWSDFVQSLIPRIRNTWAEWLRDVPSGFSLIAIIGLFASFFVPKLPRNKRIPLIIAGVLWIGTALLVQRVAPWPRVWLFLLPFFVVWVSAGLMGLFELIILRVQKGEFLIAALVGIFIAGPLILGLMRNYQQFDQKLHSKGSVEEIADFLGADLQSGDVVVVTSPDTIVLKYYLRRLGVLSEVTELVKGKSFKRAIVVVNQGYGQNLEYVLERRSFLDDVDPNSAEEIYHTNRYTLYQLSGD
jgi:hypothetical protein